MEIVSIPAIVTIVFGAMQLLKTAINKEGFTRFIPICSVVLGAILGIIAFYALPDLIPADNIWLALVIGAASGWAATGANQSVKQLTKTDKADKTE